METKNIPINKNLHEAIKQHCRANGFVMSKFVEGILCTNFKKLRGENNEQRGLQS